MIKKGFIGNSYEFEKLMKLMLNEPLTEGTIKRTQFRRVFAKAILKGAIINMFYYIKQVTKIGED